MAGQNAALVGARIRKAREEKGWTRPQLAKAMEGIVESADLYRWETGRHRPRDDTLRAIARALGRPFSYFVDDELAETPNLAAVLNGENGNGDDALLARLDALEEAVSELDEQVRLWRAEGQTRDVEARKRTAEGFQTILDLLRRRPA